MKGHVLHRARAHLKVPGCSLVWNTLLTKKLPMFLSPLNEKVTDAAPQTYPSPLFLVSNPKTQRQLSKSTLVLRFSHFVISSGNSQWSHLLKINPLDLFEL